MVTRQEYTKTKLGLMQKEITREVAQMRKTGTIAVEPLFLSMEQKIDGYHEEQLQDVDDLTELLEEKLIKDFYLVDEEKQQALLAAEAAAEAQRLAESKVKPGSKKSKKKEEEEDEVLDLGDEDG